MLLCKTSMACDFANYASTCEGSLLKFHRLHRPTDQAYLVSRTGATDEIDGVIHLLCADKVGDKGSRNRSLLRQANLAANSGAMPLWL